VAVALHEAGKAKGRRKQNTVAQKRGANALQQYQSTNLVVTLQLYGKKTNSYL